MSGRKKINRNKISSFRFGEGGEIAAGVRQLYEDTTLNKFLSELEGESDRSAVLVAAAFFDEALSLRFRSRLNSGNKKVLDSLFDMSGPLSSFSSKIDLLFCLGDIPKLMADDLHRVRKIRNYCAHHWDSFHLDEDVEAKFLLKMNTALKLYSDKNERVLLDTDVLHPRSRFIVICGMLALSLSLLVEDVQADNPMHAF